MHYRKDICQAQFQAMIDYLGKGSPRGKQARYRAGVAQLVLEDGYVRDIYILY